MTLRNTHIKNPSAYGCAPETEFSASKMCMSPAACSTPLPGLRYMSKKLERLKHVFAYKAGFGVFWRKANSQLNPVYKACHRIIACENKPMFWYWSKSDSVIYTQETYSQRSGSNRAAGNKRRALAFWFFVQICSKFPMSKCKEQSGLRLGLYKISGHTKPWRMPLHRGVWDFQRNVEPSVFSNLKADSLFSTWIYILAWWVYYMHWICLYTSE